MRNPARIIIVMLVVFLLAACGQGENINDGQKVPEAPGPEPTGQITAGPGMTATVQPVEQSGIEVINAPVLVSRLAEYPVANPEGSIGDVYAILLDGLTGQVHSLAVRVVGPVPQNTFLVPWGAFQIVTLAPNQTPGDAEAAPQVWLDVPSDVIASAPEFDPALFDQPSTVQAGWDEELRSFWSQQVPGGLPVTGSEQDPAANQEILSIEKETDIPMDFDVKNADGEAVGSINDMIITQDGTVSFVVMSPDGVEGFGTERVPVSWKALAWIPEEQTFLLNTSEETLQNAPRYNENEIPDMTVPGWDDAWNDYWNEAGLPQGDQSQVDQQSGTPAADTGLKLIRAYKDLGQPVVDQRGAAQGKVVDWVLNELGTSIFAVVDREGQMVPVPWMALTAVPNEDSLLLNMDASILANAPLYDSLDDLAADDQWDLHAMRYWQEFLSFPQQSDPSASSADLRPIWLTSILGQPVLDAGGSTLGTLEDVIFNLDGVIEYAVMHSGQILRPIPWIDFAYNFSEQVLTYIDDPVRVESAPGFARLEDIDMNTPDWDENVRSYWGRR